MLSGDPIVPIGFSMLQRMNGIFDDILMFLYKLKSLLNFLRIVGVFGRESGIVGGFGQ